MKCLLGAVLLDLALAADFAFVAPPQVAGRVQAGVFSPSARNAELPQPPKQASSGMSTALLLGATAIATALARRRAAVARRVWTFYPLEEKDYPGIGSEAKGPLWRQHQNLRKQAKKTMGRKVRYLKQQRILRDHDIWWGSYGKWHVYNENPGIKDLYKGPESHPDNPDFPAPNSGLQAFGGSRPVAFASSRSAFVGGRAPTVASAKRAVVSSPRARSALVMKAHKKAAASTKNQGHSLLPHHWGVKALNGKAVKVRTVLVKQRAMTWYPGNNVKMCKDHSLIAMRDGIVQWRGDYRHKEVSIVPWEYVNAKCKWNGTNRLAPKEYKPWMGTNFDRYSARWPIRQMFEDWKETEEGKAWIAKKEEKKTKQKEIQKKIRAKKALRWKGKKQDKVAAGESDSEAEKA